MESANARLVRARRRKALTRVTSPISGRIVTPNIKQREGQVAQAGELIATVQDTSKVLLVIAAEESAPLAKVGMLVKCRLNSLDGRLIKGTVRSVASTTCTSDDLRIEPIRSDRERLIERRADRGRDTYYILVYAELEAHDVDLLPGMSGQARIVLGEDVLWHSLAKPVLRFFRSEVWSWLP